MSTVNKEFIDFVQTEMTKEVLRFSKESLDDTAAACISKDIVAKIDWQNSALMHKGLSWIAKNYLQQMQLV